MKNSNQYNFKNIYGNRVNLLSIDNLTVEILHSWSKYSEFYKYLEFTQFQTLKESENYLKKLKNRSNGKDGYYWVISLVDGGIIGNIGVLNIDQYKRMGEIGYGIHPDYWGKGFFKETLNLLIKELIETYKFNRIWAKTNTLNLASISGLKSCGFSEEGVLRDYYLHNKTGCYSDAVILSILAKDIEANN